MNLVASTVFLSLLEVVAAHVVEPRIVGGSDVESPSKYPYHVSLQIPQPLILHHICGGSILNNRWILTAAHCVYGRKNYKVTFVKLGTINIRDGGDYYGIEHAIYHQKFSRKTLENDIAIVRVNKNITFNRNVQPITLPTEDFVDLDSPVFLIGWGHTSWNKGSRSGPSPAILQEIELRVIPNSICQEIWRHRYIRETEMCTLTKRGEGGCKGDSGGPLVANGVQIGIVSMGDPCAVGIPDIYTRVYAFVDWIEEEQINYLINAKNRDEPHPVIHFCASFSALFALPCLFSISMSF